MEFGALRLPSPLRTHLTLLLLLLLSMQNVDCQYSKWRVTDRSRRLLPGRRNGTALTFQKENPSIAKTNSLIKLPKVTETNEPQQVEAFHKASKPASPLINPTPEIENKNINRALNMTNSVKHAHFDCESLGSYKANSFMKSGNIYKGNQFKCLPCTCSRNHTRSKCVIIGNCRSKRLPEIPSTLPMQIWSLDMTHNYLTEFDTASILRFPNLNKLYLSENHKLTKVFWQTKGNSTPESKIEELHLHWNNIDSISSHSFCVMPRLRVLKLSRNRLTAIGNATFDCLEHLESLDLSFNRIRVIVDNAFYFLFNLKELFLIKNPDLGYVRKGFSPKIAWSLKRLRILHIQGNSGGDKQYPNDFLGNLTNLRELSIDALGPRVEFGSQLSHLVHLNKLNFGPHASCQSRNISSTFFQNIPHLNSLKFSHCIFENIDPSAFHFIPNLTEYTVEYIKSRKYNLDKAFQDLEGLQNSSLKSLTFVHVHHSDLQCRVLSDAQGKYIKNMTLEYLNLGNNRLALLGNDFVERIPKTLKVLSLSENKFASTGNLWGGLSQLKNLQTLDVADQNVDGYPKKFADDEYTSSSSDDTQESSEKDTNENFYDLQNYDPQIPHQSSDNNAVPYSDTYRPYYNENQDREVSKRRKTHPDERRSGGLSGVEMKAPTGRILTLPPNLRDVRASHFLFFGGILLHHPLSENSLTHLNFSNNLQTDWGGGHLPEKVEVIDLSNNHGHYLLPRFFPVRNNLKALFIQYNLLGRAFAKDVNGSILGNLNKLRHLDISVNTVYHLPPLFFRGVKSLNTLYMQENKLQVLEVHLAHMQNLSFIDASKNSISWITKKTRNDLDLLASRNPNNSISVDLTFNPLPCTCAGQAILKWLAFSKVVFINHDFMSCRFSNGSVGSLADIHLMLRTLRNDCFSYRDLIIGIVSALSGVTLALLSASLVYKKRWWLLYTINNGFLVRVFGFHPSRKSNASKFKYDAYVFYVEDDRDFVLDELLREMEETRGHKLCVEDRDFIPGTYNFNNINSAIQNSAVTLLVVSEEFLHSNEFGYVLKMALLEEFHGQHKREICHLVLYDYDQSSGTKLPKDLQMFMVNNRFITSPPKGGNDCTEEIYRGFWDRLSAIIGHTTDINSNPPLTS